MKKNSLFINTDSIVILVLALSLIVAIIYGEKEVAKMIASSLFSYITGIKSNLIGYWK